MKIRGKKKKTKKTTNPKPNPKKPKETFKPDPRTKHMQLVYAEVERNRITID